MKKWFLALLGLLVFTGCKNGDDNKINSSSLQQTSNVSSEGLEFKLTPTEDSYEVSGIDGFSYSGVKLVIPSSHNNLPVTSIGDSAFDNNLSLTSVQIPKSVKYIGEGAFNDCNNLYKIEFEQGSNLTEINDYVFSGCYSLRTITIPKSVTSINRQAFFNCNLETIEFEENSNLTYIGEEAFCQCDSITSITIPKSVVELGDSAFYACTSLESVTFEQGSNLEAISKWAFYGCALNKSISLPDKVKQIGIEAFGGCDFSSIEIPSSVEIIHEGAFKKCKKLKMFTFEENSKLNEIKKEAFSHCSYLETINLPQGLTKIGDRVFDHCSSLSTIDLPNGLMEIGEYVFSYCNSLTTINIPNSISRIGFNAFDDCIFLQYNEYGNCLYLGNKDNPNLVLVKAINPSIKEVTISESARVIMNGAFSGCESIDSIFVPKNVVSISPGAFRNCRKTIFLFETASWPEHWIDIFDSSSVICKHLGVNKNDLFSQNGLKFLLRDGEAIIIGNDLDNLGNKEVNIPSKLEINSTIYNVTRIDSKAFYDCDSLETISFDEDSKLISIGDYAFYSCESLKLINIPNSVVRIGESAFEGCVKLNIVNINDDCKLENIARSAFSNCSMLESINLPNGVTTINENTFSNCANLSSINIPNNIQEIDYTAFNGCPLKHNRYENGLYLGNEENPYLVFTGLESENITRVSISEQTRIILDCAFINSNLQSIIIPDNVISIGDRVFNGCNNLNSVVIPSSVKSIGFGLFDLCFSIESITVPYLGATQDDNENDVLGYLFGEEYDTFFYTKVPNSLREVIITDDTRIGDFAFYRCNSLSKIAIPNNINYVGDNAFHGCDSLTYNEYENGLYLGSEENPYLLLIKAKNTSIKNASISDSTRIIYSNAFSYCSSLLSITIPSNVIYVGDYAFSFCDSIIIYCEEECVPETWSESWVRSAGPVYWGVKEKIIQDGIIYIISNDKIIATGCTEELPTQVEINSQIKINDIIYDVIIGNYLFRGNTTMESLTLPFLGSSLDQSTHFGYLFGAYSYSEQGKFVPSSLKEVKLTGGSSILDYAFYNCSSLTTISLPNSITYIGKKAFLNCSSIESIVIPESVIEIGEDAFKNCSSLTIYCEATSKKDCWSSTWNSSNCTVYWGDEWKYVDGVPTLK